MDDIKPGEIVYCNITYRYNKQYRNRTITETAELIDVVFGSEYKCSYPHLDYKSNDNSEGIHPSQISMLVFVSLYNHKIVVLEISQIYCGFPTTHLKLYLISLLQFYYFSCTILQNFLALVLVVS